MSQLEELISNLEQENKFTVKSILSDPNIPDIEFQVFERQDGDKKIYGKILCLTGAWGKKEQYNKLAESFAAEGYSTTTVDYPKHTSSESENGQLNHQQILEEYKRLSTNKLTLDTYILSVVKFILKHYDEGETVHIMVHSMGGVISYAVSDIMDRLFQNEELVPIIGKKILLAPGLNGMETVEVANLILKIVLDFKNFLKGLKQALLMKKAKERPDELWEDLDMVKKLLFSPEIGDKEVLSSMNHYLIPESASVLDEVMKGTYAVDKQKLKELFTDCSLILAVSNDGLVDPKILDIVKKQTGGDLYYIDKQNGNNVRSQWAHMFHMDEEFVDIIVDIVIRYLQGKKYLNEKAEG